ncbi:MAG: hypothetical protein PHD48_08775 [Alphaproteobacteria bacterium]|nr:hypothetical protein [Alphaproteobacteria bacterium]
MGYLLKHGHLSLSFIAAIMLGGFCVLAVVFISSSAIAERLAYEMVDKDLYNGEQPTLMTAAGKARVKQGLAALEQSGMAALIDAQFGADSEEGALYKAITIRESNGGLNPLNQESKAACEFQVSIDNQKGWYKGAGYATPAQFQTALLTIPSVCLEYGIRAFEEQKASAGRNGYSGDDLLDRALCGYAGELRMYREQKFCWASDEYKLTAARVLKRDFTYTNVDKKSGKLGHEITVDKKTGKVLAEVFLCKDHLDEIPLALAKMADAYKVTRTQVEQDTFAKVATSFEANGIKLHIEPREALCIDVKLNKYEKIIDSYGSSFLENYAKKVLKDLLESACNYVLTQSEIALQNLLNLSCVPLPNLRFGLGVDLPSLESTTCNGVSLMKAYVRGSGSLLPSEVEEGLDALYPEGTLPAVIPLPSFSIGGMSPVPSLRHRIEIGNGQYEYY